MIYFVSVIVALFVGLLLLRLRFRVEFASGRRILAVQIGHSGPEIDLASKTGHFQLFGYSIKRFSLQAGRKKRPEKDSKRARPEKQKTTRKRSWRDLPAILPQVTSAFWHYSISIIKSATIETLEAEIEAGLAEPHLTGQLFGFYQATLAALPSAIGRVSFTPDWSGASFSGSAKVAVAVPVYKLVFRTILLLKDLPLRKMYKLAIGQKRGASDG